MRAHHAQVAELLAEAAPLLANWRATPEPARGEQLADAYERMLGVLKVRLRREVVEVVPVAERVVTAEEWKAMGDHSAGAIPTSRLLPQPGMLLANSTPADRESFYTGMPLFIKVPRGQASVREAVQAIVSGRAGPSDRLSIAGRT